MLFVRSGLILKPGKPMMRIERAPGTVKAWSPEDDAKLIEMRAAGKKWAFIAKELGRTEASVATRSLAIRRRVSRGRITGTG